MQGLAGVAEQYGFPAQFMTDLRELLMHRVVSPSDASGHRPREASPLPMPGLMLHYPGHRPVPSALRAFVDVLKEANRRI
jgi:DNA-binding transcriptional LysR family regulator